MFLIMIGGQNILRRVPWLLNNLGRIQKIFGVIMILTAIGIFFNIDRKFQTFILNTFPQYGVGLTKFEDNDAVKKQLNQSTNTTTSDLLDLNGPVAPEIIAGGGWFGSAPLTIKSLKGKVVIIDFWTYSCINCQRTLPYLKNWYEKYKDKGLVIIGVHSPEFEFEKKAENVAQAIKDFGITYPVVQDNDFATWRAYSNMYWPAKYFIDKNGIIRHTHFGEGEYDESERVIQELLKEAGSNDVSLDINNPTYQNYARTPETYLGSKRSNYLAKLTGNWNVTEEYAVSTKDDSLEITFEAKEVYLVMRPEKRNSKVEVFVDDVLSGTVEVDGDKLYKLVTLPVAGKHILKLKFQVGVEVYAFTFG